MVDLFDKKKAFKAYEKNSISQLPKIVDQQVYAQYIDDKSDKNARKTITSILEHKDSVYKKLTFLAKELILRAKKHDDSKLEEPEINYLIEMDKEPMYPYGSEEYFNKMERWSCFFNAHYNNLNNRHHPDHFDNGINDMNILDLCEFMVDIISYFDEFHIADAISTIDKQQERFGLSNQLADILKNTLIEYYTGFAGDNSLYEKHINKYLQEEKLAESKIELNILKD